MEKRPTSTLDTSKIATPAFVIEEALLRHNLSILRHVKERTGCKMYQALKAWSTWELFPVVREYLDGTEASSLNEARLGYEEFNHDVHVYAPAYKDEEFDELLRYSSTIIFNSVDQWKKFKPRIEASGKQIECGLRLNPENISKDEHGGLWSPTAPGSRLGVRRTELEAALTEDRDALQGISGFHFHVFWDKTLPDLREAVRVIEDKFGTHFSAVKWINFGGGQMITNDDYDVEGLIALINDFQTKYSVRVHLEPGAAIVKNAGALVASVLDVVERDDVPYKIAILDMSFNAHTPDFLLSRDLDMPVRGARALRDEKKLKGHAYRLGGGTCVTGDTLGHFHIFEKSLRAGDKIVLEDGIQYNMVQCTMFNGVQHPSIVLWKDDAAETLRAFTFEDYKARMG
ncbi:MAG: carboxynorspermidine decarboxylase [Candidatus Kaiserbacteria bacterium]|nr:MAG: carboxynorspermidine decarboxylase [Candidatus Kaiserbacteria bacterium]